MHSDEGARPRIGAAILGEAAHNAVSELPVAGVSVDVMAPFPPPPLAPPPCADDGAELLPLVAVIEFKWLAAGIGQHLHVERMQHDPVYARGVLDAAETSSHEMLQRAAARLRVALARGRAPG
jgi:hypothetical protein